MSATPEATPAPAGPTRTVHGYAALEREGPVTPWDFEQREPRPDDVAFDVLFCGICHTDLHSIGPWGQEFPIVPGHEMVGRVTAVGTEVIGRRDRRHRRGQRHRRLLRRVRPLQERDGDLLRAGPDQHLRRHRPGRRQPHPRRLRRVPGRPPALRPQGAGRPRPGRRRAAALRRGHHLVAAAPLGGRPGQHGRRGRDRRPRPPRGQVRPRARRPRRRLHHLPGQARHDPRPRRRRGRRLHRRRADGRPRPQPRLPPRHRLGDLPDGTADGDAEARRRDLLGRHPRRVRRRQHLPDGLAPPQPRQLRRRRHRGRPRDARLLRRARHHRRGRGRRPRRDQRGARPPRQERRPLSLRDRHARA